MEIEVVEVQVEEVMMHLAEEEMLPEEVVQDDIEYVDLLPADAEAEFELRDALDGLLPDVNEEFVPIPPVVPRAPASMRDRPAGIQHELPDQHNILPLNVVCPVHFLS
ncbi:uncharacterized protein LOC111030315 [Myzus persicae]|uniref:uncharacterized protein LOC111030315 n=1 Tax=Myzus persicae TaxID=13164 RepID=UPI000B935AB1|nr:uncharacterized protein LOC111030315 [Myzus persicae]